MLGHRIPQPYWWIMLWFVSAIVLLICANLLAT